MTIYGYFVGAFRTVKFIFRGIINDIWNFCSEPLGHPDTKGNLDLTVSKDHEITVSLTDNKIVIFCNKIFNSETDVFKLRH